MMGSDISTKGSSLYFLPIIFIKIIAKKSSNKILILLINLGLLVKTGAETPQKQENATL